jgi:hypothetical protein
VVRVVSSEGSGSDCADETKWYRPEGQKHTGLTDPGEEEEWLEMVKRGEGEE